MSWILVTVGAVVILSFLREVKQYERGVMLTMGKFTGIRSPGWSIVVPIFQRMTKVDLRVKAVDVPDQKVITKDNVSASINAVIYSTPIPPTVRSWDVVSFCVETPLCDTVEA
jgi:regulator of protease activity HflC (stomatin/prohibitin superfamily)